MIQKYEIVTNCTNSVTYQSLKKSSHHNNTSGITIISIKYWKIPLQVCDNVSAKNTKKNLKNSFIVDLSYLEIINWLIYQIFFN